MKTIKKLEEHNNKCYGDNCCEKNEIRIQTLKSVINLISKFEFKCCDTGNECSTMSKLKEELKQKIEGK